MPDELNAMFAARARALEDEFAAVEAALSAAAAAGEPGRLRDLSRERSRLEPMLESARRFMALRKKLAEAEALQEDAGTDADLRQLAADEAAEANAALPLAVAEFRRLLLPPDPDAGRPLLVEIRAGTGGEEAALFAGDLHRMYTHFAERHDLALETLSLSRSDLGGCKEIIFSVTGPEAWSRFRFEGGVHRVQRVPVTEASGRIHTSAATVAVLPEPDEVEIRLDPNELRIDVFRSQGPGGQSVNTTDSAVRVTHLPTGLVVSCQDEKSQLKNKHKALRVLRARLKEQEEEKRRSERASARRSMVGSGDRSERIRTYNFPQNRVTDHRLELTIYALTDILAGDLDKVVGPLQLADQEERLRALAGKP